MPRKHTRRRHRVQSHGLSERDVALEFHLFVDPTDANHAAQRRTGLAGLLSRLSFAPPASPSSHGPSPADLLAVGEALWHTNLQRLVESCVVIHHAYVSYISHAADLVRALELSSRFSARQVLPSQSDPPSPAASDRSTSPSTTPPSASPGAAASDMGRRSSHSYSWQSFLDLRTQTRRLVNSRSTNSGHRRDSDALSQNSVLAALLRLRLLLFKTESEAFSPAPLVSALLADALNADPSKKPSQALSEAFTQYLTAQLQRVESLSVLPPEPEKDSLGPIIMQRLHFVATQVALLWSDFAEMLSRYQPLRTRVAASLRRTWLSEERAIARAAIYAETILPCGPGFTHADSSSSSAHHHFSNAFIAAQLRKSDHVRADPSLATLIAEDAVRHRFLQATGVEPSPFDGDGDDQRTAGFLTRSAILFRQRINFSDPLERDFLESSEFLAEAHQGGSSPPQSVHQQRAHPMVQSPPTLAQTGALGLRSGYNRQPRSRSPSQALLVPTGSAGGAPGFPRVYSAPDLLVSPSASPSFVPLLNTAARNAGRSRSPSPPSTDRDTDPTELPDDSDPSLTPQFSPTSQPTPPPAPPVSAEMRQLRLQKRKSLPISISSSPKGLVPPGKRPRDHSADAAVLDPALVLDGNDSPVTLPGSPDSASAYVFPGNSPGGGVRFDREAALPRSMSGATSPNVSVSSSPTAPQSITASNQRPTESDVPKGSHLVIFVHGFHGSSADFRMFRNHMALLFSPSNDAYLYLMSRSNEGKTDTSIAVQGEALGREVAAHLQNLASGGTVVGRISFLAHSLGGLVVRAALATTALAKHLALLWTFVSLSSPHLGVAHGSNAVVGSALWVWKRWASSTALHELTFSDSEEVQETLLYMLTQHRSFELFRHVILVSSEQDGYIPSHSARVQLCKEALDDKSSARFVEMTRNILRPLWRCAVVERVDVYFPLDKPDLERVLGRAAHLMFLENPQFVHLFLLEYRNLFS
eukprot:TRINITY_DN4168_c0_g1_i1.p1 TRINITY_DN4168_c0_g1~~TRINITY_DN4168_c0_g1_i1.p1  ORF type:complete len:984 (+),score=156.79 TRINITY_DN4168_c0_g1_i1:872-3823(+)